MNNKKKPTFFKTHRKKIIIGITFLSMVIIVGGISAITINNRKNSISDNIKVNNEEVLVDNSGQDGVEKQEVKEKNVNNDNKDTISIKKDEKQVKEEKIKESNESKESVKDNDNKDKEKIDKNRTEKKVNKEENNEKKTISKNINEIDKNNNGNNDVKKSEEKTKEQQSKTKVKEEHKKGFNGEAFAGCQQVMVVTNDSKGSRSAKISTYEKENGQWKVVRQNMYSTIGKNGMEYSSRRKQNTYTTPAGIFSIEYMFGWGGNPGVKYQYKVPDDNSYWNLNNGASTYNRWVEGNPGGDNEHLKTQRLYKQAIVLDYNMEQIPNKGGAIFIHLNPNQYTGGCIGLNESDLVSVMKWLNPSKNPKVLICPSGDLSKYYN